MEALKFKGGAAVGMFFGYNTSIATLSVTNSKIELNLHLLIKLSFTAADKISFIPYRSFPLFKECILIKHSNSEYKKHVLFGTDESFHVVVSKIKECGFPLHE